MRYVFDEFELDCSTRELSKNGALIPTEPQVFNLLEYLITHADRTVSKDELIEHIWNGRIISDGAINSRVRSARISIDDNGKDQRRLKTVHGVGFRFRGDFEKIACEDGNELTPSSPKRATLNTDRPTKKNTKKTFSNVLIVLIAILAMIILGTGVFFTFQTNEDGVDKVSTRDDRTVSIAVLPFVDMSEAQDQQYFGEGIAEELLNALSKVSGLRVTSRTSSFAFRGDLFDTQKIANSLSVSHILEGSIRRSGDLIRITAQLIETSTDAHIWSETYDVQVSAKTVFDTQTDIANAITRTLDEKLSPVTQQTPGVSTTSITAYQAYLRAQSLEHSRTGEALDEALLQYNIAIKADPAFALAYAGRAHVNSLRDDYVEHPDFDVIDLMRRDIGAATAINPKLPEVLFAAATLANKENRHADTLAITEQINELHPNFAPAYQLLGTTLLNLGRLEEARSTLRQGLILDPISPFMLNTLADIEFRLGKLSDAFKTAESNAKWNPLNSTALDMMGYIHWQRGDYVKAHEQYLRAKRLNPEDAFVTDALIMMYSELGMDEEALSIAHTNSHRAFALALIGRGNEALELMAEGPNGITDGEVAFIAGDIDVAAKLMIKQVANQNMLNDAPIASGDGDLYAESCFLFQNTKHAFEDTICGKTSAFYSNTSARDILPTTDIYGGAVWHATYGRYDEAVDWLNTLFERGALDTHVTVPPTLKPLEDHAEFQSIYRNMLENAKLQRQKIKASLQAKQ